LLRLIPEPHAGPLPVADHRLRLIHGDGKWCGIVSIAEQVFQKLAMLGFQRSNRVTATTEKEIHRLLNIAEKLCRELHAQEIRFAQEEI